MAYADQEMSTRRVVSLGVVALLHAGMGYALITGLAYDAAKQVFKDLETFDVAEEEPEPEEPPPPPEKLDIPPPPKVTAPPPVVKSQVVSQNTQTVVITPSAPPAPPPPPPAPPAPPPPPAVVKAQKAQPKGQPGNWATTDDYPSSAIRAEEQGTTGFRVEVGPDGRVTSCSVTRSSGSSTLDEATCRLVTRRARFTPAKDTSGAAISDTYSNNIRWVLPE
jgi:periplasmic protein TonB